MADRPLQLKSFLLPTRVIQSPMANCTDLPFRLLARRYGMRLAFLEMVSAEGLLRENRDTRELMETIPEDRPLGTQLVGCDAARMGEAAARVEALGYDWLDLNLGCPVPKVTGKGGGSALLREPDTARAIFTSVARAIKCIPLTVKMRLGYADATGAEAAHIARIAEDCGVDAVSVHGRTREQGYAGTADYAAIGRVKAAVRIPVFGNGDVVDGESARRLLAVSGCDGVLLGRGALGNPWIYRQVEAALEGGAPVPSPSFAEKKRALLEHLELQVRYCERSAVVEMRRIAPWYFKEVPGVADFRGRINRAQSLDEVRSLIEGFEPLALTSALGAAS